MKFSSREFVDFVFAPDGLLSRFVKDYEHREEQRQMALQILDAYEKDKVALIEAGTGVGKSWAYLVPAVYWALVRGEQTVVSTNTIPLQEQLLFKDIPFLLKTLDLDLQAVLVKGMSNYLCLRKLSEIQNEKLLLTQEEFDKFSQIEHWAEDTTEGSYSEIPFPVPSSLWEKVAAERSSCNHVQCPHYKQCYFFKARKQISEANLLVVNHHLLMSDLVAKMQTSGDERSILPKFQRVVIDEAHHIDEVALESFSRKMDRLDLVRWLGRLFSDNNPEKSRCFLLAKELIALGIQVTPLTVLLETEIPAEKRLAVVKVEELFKRIEFFCQTYLQEDTSSESKEVKWRLKPENFIHSYWQEEIKPQFFDVVKQFHKITSLLALVLKEILSLDRSLQEKLSIHTQEIGFVADKLTAKASDLEQFVSNETDLYRVRWIEMTSILSNLILIDASLNIADMLKEHLFDQRTSSVLCSATLTAQGNFSYIKDRVGLNQSNVQENIYPSPFDYQARTMLAIPKDIPFPSAPLFITKASEMIAKAIEASMGSCLVLFTSYDMLLQCHQRLKERVTRYPIYKQGDASRQVLIEKFKAKEGNVLFATDSFWEGIDIPGEALRMVILVKLPFKVPSDPVYQAFSEVYTKEGKDPFTGYSVPHASLKFKQGFGRLMRKKNDRGCVLCLDKRLMAKSYGALFLKGIPSSQRLYENSETLFPKIKEFYSKTPLTAS